MAPSHKAIKEGISQTNGNDEAYSATGMSTSIHPDALKPLNTSQTSPGLDALLNSFLATVCPTEVIRHKGFWTRFRTLSMSGREVMLAKFRRQRPSQRQAIIDAVLNDLTPEEKEEVHAQVEKEKDRYTKEIDEARERWVQELKWGPPKPWNSEGVTWTPGPSQDWADSDEEASTEAGHEDEEETDKDSYCQVETVDGSEGSEIDAPTFLTDDDDDDEYDEKQEDDDELGQTLDHFPAVALPQLEASSPEHFEENDHSGDDFANNPKPVDDVVSWTLHVDGATSAGCARASDWFPYQFEQDRIVSNTNGTQEDKVKSENAPYYGIDDSQQTTTFFLDIDTAEQQPSFPKWPARSPEHNATDSSNDGTQEIGNNVENAQDHETDSREDFQQSATVAFDLETSEQQPTFPEWPTAPMPNSPPLSPIIKSLAEKILPIVLDKDEPDFIRSMKQSIEIYHQRGDTYRWTPALERCKPRPGPSPLREVEHAAR